MKVAVVGAGAMGRNHVRVYRDLPGVEMVAIADGDAATAVAVAGAFGCEPYTDYREMLEVARPEAVSVAVPTHAHHQVVLDALAAGCHVLVEKPIASSLAEAADMVQLAERAGRLLAVGHIERYNPAIIELKRRLEAGELGRTFQIHARRLGPFPARVRDVGVVIDLATHDIDIMRYLSGSEAVRVYAETKREVHTSNEDLLNGLVRFENDMLGVLEINWLTPTKIRELYVTGERGMFRADYLTQDLYFFENAEVTGVQYEALSMLRGVSEGAMIRFALQRAEPLRAELESFVAAVGGEDARTVSGRDGLEALTLALAMIESANTNRALPMGR
jgi:UDP-N-acetylglucosamine 3-dehydrogenase